MNTNKFLVGGIIGGVANFLLGWLVWGMLLMNFMTQHCSEASKAINRSEDNMIWWAMIVGNLAFGFLMSYILNKAGANSVAKGAGVGAVVGLLSAIGYDCMMYSMMDMMDTTAIAVDVAASTVVNSIVGGIIGWYLGMGKKAA
jgi:hypothetical protein